MDHLHKDDMSVGYEDGDDEFDYGGHPETSVASSGASFSTASTASTASSLYDPFTPTSGRSTPCGRPVTILPGYDNALCPTPQGYDMSPPPTFIDGCLPEIKSEYSLGCDRIPETPSRRMAAPIHNIMYDYTNVFGASLGSQGNTIENTHTNPQALENYFTDGFSQTLPHDPSATYSLSTTSVDLATMWASWHPGNQMIFGSPSMPSSSRQLSRNTSAPQSYLASNGRQRPYSEDTQQKTTALHRGQQHSHHMQELKRSRSMQDPLNGSITTIPKGGFFCDLLGCENRKAFKRSEHLKRHKTTAHNPDPHSFEVCEFCQKRFNRKDNWRQHLKLHTLPDRQIARTQYNADAKAVYDSEMRKTKHRNQAKRKANMLNIEDAR